MIGSVRQFAAKHLASADRDFVPNEEAVRVDGEFEKVQTGLAEVTDTLDSVDENTKLRAPGLKNFKNSELVAGGALAGAAIGGMVGVGKELLASSLSAPSVEIVETEHDIMRTTLADGDQPWRVNSERIFEGGIWTKTRHTYEPITETERVGSYTTREAEVTGNGNGSVLTSGLIGMGVGAAMGAGIGASVMVARKFIPDGEYEEGERRETKGDAGVIARWGVKGAAIGAGAGALIGLVESRHNSVRNFTTEAPITGQETIGQIPQSWVEESTSTSPGGGDMADVKVTNPETNLLGRAKVEKIDKSVDVNGRYGVVSGAIGGAIIGGASGVAIGVLENIVRKSI